MDTSVRIFPVRLLTFCFAIQLASITYYSQMDQVLADHQPIRHATRQQMVSIAPAATQVIRVQ